MKEGRRFVNTIPVQYKDGTSEQILVYAADPVEASAALTDSFERLSGAFFLLADAQGTFAKLASRVERMTETMVQRQARLARSQQLLGASR